MNKVLDVKVVAMNAMIATVYAVLTIACASISYGAINLRISEIIVFLAFFNRKYIPGLIVGCFLANLASPMGIYDIINGLIVGAELYWVLNLPFMINAFYVFVGETIVLIVGAILFQLLQKNTIFMKKYIME